MNPASKDPSQQCPICKSALQANERYPRYICPDCATEASDESGRPLRFSNVSMSGGFQGAYADSGEAYLSHVCFVKGIRCWADEAKFGGIVIQAQTDQNFKSLNSWHVSVAAESIVASLFARIGYDVSVQYGANQPEYDLLIARGDRLAKVSVKGSQDGSWGLTQKHLKGLAKADYHGAIEKWEASHSRKTIFALVQFKGVSLHELPRVYLSTPTEIAERLRATSKGKGDTILHENKVWTSKAHGAGTIDAIPDSWRFSQERVQQLISDLTYLP